MRRLMLLSILFAAPTWAVNYACVSAAGNNGVWKTPGNWTGCGSAQGYPDGADGNAYAVTIATGHHMTLPTGVTILGEGGLAWSEILKIQATDATTYGSVTIPDGATLDVRGNAAAKYTIYLLRYAQLIGEPGGTILFSAGGDTENTFYNLGIVRLQGSAAKRFTVTGAVTSWNNAGSLTVSNQGPFIYRPANYVEAYSGVKCSSINRPWLSNAAGTGLGAYGNSSLSFSTVTPTGILATEVATLDDVNGAGKWWAEYKTSMVCWYQATEAQTTTFTANYKYLTYSSWGSRTRENTTYNEFVADYVDFLYAGSPGGNSTNAVACRYSVSDAQGGTVHNCSITNSRFYYVAGPIWLDSVNGATVTDNLFDGTSNFAAYAGGVTLFLSADTSNVTISRNVFLTGAPVILHYGAYSMPNLTVTDNVSRAQVFIVGNADGPAMPDCLISRNVSWGWGGIGVGNTSPDGRTFSRIKGTAGHPCTVSDNLIVNPFRGFNISYYTNYDGNYMSGGIHHHMMGPNGEGNASIIDAKMRGNVFTRGTGCSYIEFGYVGTSDFPNATATNNVIYGSPLAGMYITDSCDQGMQMITAGLFHSNLITNNGVGVSSTAESGVRGQRFHFAANDFNNLYGNGTAFGGFWNRFSTVSGLTNITGLSLYNPSYAPPQSGKSLVYTYTSDTNATLAWDGGSALQLVMSSGTATSGTTLTLTDTGKAWTTAFNTPTTTPQGGWVKITGGTGIGQVRRVTLNTGTVLTVGPAFDTAPDATSTYAVWRGSVQLTASGATTIWAGWDLALLPTSSQTDSAVAVALNGFTYDPRYMAPNRSIASWDAWWGGTGTEGGAWTRLVANPLLGANLVAYLRAGLTATNLELKGRGYLGADIGIPIRVYNAPGITGGGVY